MTLSKAKFASTPFSSSSSQPASSISFPFQPSNQVISREAPFPRQQMMNHQLGGEKNGMMMAGVIGNGTLSNGTFSNGAAGNGNRPYETHPTLIRNHHHHHHQQQQQLHLQFHERHWHIKDEVLPQIVAHDAFVEWPKGYTQRAYSSSCPDAKSHQSGWAMRNTNNHDPKRLKKSCLGVMVCNRNCVTDDGRMIHIRPYICDKARRRQEKSPCPTKGCEGHLVQMKCKGHSGKPVTHIWRTEGKTIFFQARGEHDHPQPEPKMSVNARRMIDSKKRIGQLPNAGRRNPKKNAERKFRNPVGDSPSIQTHKHPRGMKFMIENPTQMSSYYGNNPGGGVYIGVAPNGGTNHHQLSPLDPQFNPSVVVPPYIDLKDCPPPLSQSQPLWPDPSDLLTPIGTGLESTVHCRNAFCSVDELSAPMVNPMVNPPLEFFPEFPGVVHPNRNPVSLFYPPTQPNFNCDPAGVIHEDGHYRYPGGGGGGVGGMIPEDTVNLGSAADDFYFNDGSSRIHPSRWSTSGHVSSSIHQSPPSAINPYYSPIQYHPQQQQQQVPMKFQHSTFFPATSSSSPSPSSSSDLLPLFASASTATDVCNELPPQQQQQQQQHAAVFQLYHTASAFKCE